MTTSIHLINGKIYYSVKSLQTQLDISQTTILSRVSEVEEEIVSGFYPKTAVIRDGGILLVNILVFIHYLTNRQLIKSGAKKHVLRFDAKEIAKDSGWHTILHDL